MTDPTLPILRSVEAMRAQTRAWRAAGLTVGFAPTMGALHAGHASLITALAARCDRVVASVFVNPTQFAPGEDFDSYPRDEAGDVAVIARAGGAAVFAPPSEALYPENEATRISVAGPALELESAARPHFFTGVATVVAKLLIAVEPDEAAFGEKDYQQLLVVRRLVRDLCLATHILACPTARDPDGLALSSRNAYLDASARAIAPALHRAITDCAQAVTAGDTPRAAERAAVDAILASGFDAVDYVAVRDAETLAAVPDTALEREGRVLAAARLGGVRLIDNVAAPAP